MDNYALENFIDFCDNMEIAQEGKILDRIKSAFSHKSKKDPLSKYESKGENNVPGSIVYAIYDGKMDKNVPNATYGYTDLQVSQDKIDAIVSYLAELTDDHPSIYWDTFHNHEIGVSTKDKKILDKPLTLCQLKIVTNSSPKTSSLNGTATLLSIEEGKTLSEICKDCGILVNVFPDPTPKRKAILAKVFKINKVINERYSDIAGIHLYTSMKELIQTDKFALNDFLYSIHPNDDGIQIGVWDLEDYFKQLTRQGVSIRTREDWIESPQSETFYGACNQIEMALREALNSEGIKVYQDGDWDDGSYYINLA